MLISVSADKESFRKVEFKEGLNIILSDKFDPSPGETRNGTGKSSLIEIIHFCLGGSSKNSLKKEILKNWTFTLELQVNGKRFKVSRNTTEEPNKIFVQGDFSDWKIKPEKEGRFNVISVKNLKKVLANLLFGMDLEYPGHKYSPTFRSCLSYFARKDGELGGYLSPFSHYRQQLEWDIQINNAYLLGLDWTIASRWQILKDRKKVLDQIKSEAEYGVLENMGGSLGELEAKRAQLENDIKLQEKQLNEFRVHPQYRKIEEDANGKTKEIHDLVNQNVSDSRLLNHYKKSLDDESDIDTGSIKDLYEEAGVVIPEKIQKRLEDVKDFHKKIVHNRRDFLDSEIKRLEHSISKREQKIEELSEKRRDLMNILKNHKALDEYTNLQKRHSELVSQLENIKKQIENVRKFEEGQSSYKIDLEVLQQQARTSLSERKRFKDKAVNLFNSNSKRLYNSPGVLNVDVKKKGYDFSVKIERQGSQGIGKMKIFCYDLMRAQMLRENGFSLDFLMHDSTIFADVDERQIAQALQLASEESLDKGFQYICTMNSDNLPESGFDNDFDIKDHIVKRLDDSESGGLFGFRF